MQEILPDYLCVNSETYKLKNETGIQVLKRITNKLPLIIRRNTSLNIYEIKTDYDLEQSKYGYYLAIEPETNPTQKYIIINSMDSKFLYIDKHPSIKAFLKSIQKSIVYQKTFTHINNIINAKIDINLNIYNYLDALVNNGYKFVIHTKYDCILGLMKIVKDKNVFYMIPKITTTVNSSGEHYTSKYVLENIRSKNIKYPDINNYFDLLTPQDMYCYDIITNKITGIFWHEQNYLMLTDPIDTEQIKTTKIKYRLYDTSNYHELLLNDDDRDDIKPKNKLGLTGVFHKITKSMLKRFVYLGWDFNQDEQKNKEQYIKLLEDYHLLTPDETVLVKRTSLLYDFFECKLNKSEYLAFLENNFILFDKESININVYNTLKDEMKLPCDLLEVVKPKLII